MAPLALLALAGTGVAAGIGASRIATAQAEQVKADAEASAQQSEIEAQRIDEETNLELQRSEVRNRARVGALRGQLARSGFQESGSALDLIKDETIEQKIEDALTRSRGRRGATDQRTQSSFLRASATSKAGIIRTSGRQQQFASTVGGLTQGIQVFSALR